MRKNSLLHHWTPLIPRDCLHDSRAISFAADGRGLFLRYHPVDHHPRFSGGDSSRRIQDRKGRNMTVHSGCAQIKIDVLYFEDSPQSSAYSRENQRNPARRRRCSAEVREVLVSDVETAQRPTQVLEFAAFENAVIES